MTQNELPSKRLKNIIVALDNMDKTEILEWMEKAKEDISFIKLGLEVFYRYGRSFVEDLLKRHQVKLFLDLKLHDIPNTVSKSILSLEGLPIDFLTLHLTGGEQMLKAACQAQKKALPQTKLLGVSYLTSLDDNDFFQIWGVEHQQIPRQFERLFDLAHKTQIQGLVCSAREASALRDYEKLNALNPLQLVCPGIRFADEIKMSQNMGDQKRVYSPRQAFDSGADYLVMGRSLTQTPQLEERLKQLYLVEKNI